jgi:hypothetical protein
MERPISWQHFPRKEKRKNNNKARMDIRGTLFAWSIRAKAKEKRRRRS